MLALQKTQFLELWLFLFLALVSDIASSLTEWVGGRSPCYKVREKECIMLSGTEIGKTVTISIKKKK